jgi:hypothetical protein
MHLANTIDAHVHIHLDNDAAAAAAAGPGGEGGGGSSDARRGDAGGFGAARPGYWHSNISSSNGTTTTVTTINQRIPTRSMAGRFEAKLREKIFRVGKHNHSTDECGRKLVNAKVTKVERIENSMLWNNYCRARDALREKFQMFHFKPPKLAGKSHVELPPDDVIDGELNEFWLFHGTAASTVDVLATAGFDARVASLKGLFGYGARFLGPAVCVRG